MDSNTTDASDRTPYTNATPSSASFVMSSPVTSVFSKGHSSRGSGSSSSLASSPIPRESFDLYGSRLGKVTEEPQERDEMDGYTLVDSDVNFADDYERCFSPDSYQSPPIDSPSQVNYGLHHQQALETALAGQQQAKRQRSVDHSPSINTHRFSSRFNSISRRWKNRSGAAPQLSIVTHAIPPKSRSSSATSSQIISPALSAISKHESYLPPSPIRMTLDEAFYDAESDPISIEVERTHGEEIQPHASTPLLPPIFTELSKKESPIHSPLQSPSIAPTAAVMSNRTSCDTPPTAMLPSPPLSAKPSVISMHQRSRTNTTTASPIPDIPPMQLLDELYDPWALQLGHANFNIYPEPYAPEKIDVDSYTEFRANWDHARTNYAKHLARTIEHYGSTSKVFRMTEDKWNSIDATWKRHNDAMTKILTPILARASDSEGEMQDFGQSSAVLEKPVTRIIIPAINDNSGKFPELGDGEIVGLMTVGPPRNLNARKKSPDPSTPPQSPRKRNLMKFLSEVFGRN